MLLPCWDDDLHVPFFTFQTTLRQEGAVVPVKQRCSPRKGISSDTSIEEREQGSSDPSESSQDDDRYRLADEESQPSTSRLSEHEQLPSQEVHSQGELRKGVIQ